MERDEVILIDTHVIIWLATGDTQLGGKSRKLIDRSRDNKELLFSAVSFWEISLLKEKVRLRVKQTPEEIRRQLVTGGAAEVTLNGNIAIDAATLNMHNDPADRFIVATALAHNAILMTADEKLLQWSGSLARHDASQ